MTDKKIEVADLAAIEAGQGLQVWSAEPAVLETWGRALQERYSVTLCTDLSHVTVQKDGAVLLLARAPAEVLCGLLHEGLDLAVACSRITAEMQALLGLQRRCRRRALLLDLALLRQNVGAVLGCCGVQVGTQKQQDLKAATAEVPDTVFMALAQTALMGDPVLSRLAGEFVAATAVVPGVTRPEESADQVLLTYARAQDKFEELTLLKAQQRSMYEQLEQLYSEKTQVEQRLEQTRAGLDSFQAQTRNLGMEAERLKARMAAKSEVLAATGQMLQDLEQLAGHRSREVAGLNQEVADLQEQVQRFRNSRSYRLTNPLRRLRHLLRGRG